MSKTKYKFSKYVYGLPKGEFEKKVKQLFPNISSGDLNTLVKENFQEEQKKTDASTGTPKQSEKPQQ